MTSRLILSYKLLNNDHLFKLEYDGLVKDIKTSDFEIKSLVDGHHTKLTITSSTDILLVDAKIVMNHKYHEDDSFFLNGFQTWTDSLEYPYDYELRNVKNIAPALLNRFSFDKYGETDFYKYQKNVFHAFDISYLYGADPLFIGSLNYQNAYLIIEHYKHTNKLILKSDVEGKRLNPQETLRAFSTCHMSVCHTLA